MALIFKRELKKKMLDFPELTIEWIHCLEFNEFKKRNFEDLIVSVIFERLDLKDLLIKDGYEARKVIQFLDKSLDRKAFKGKLFDVLRGMLKDVEITKIILKIAAEYRISTTYYPNAVMKRRLADFLYNLHQRGKEEYSQLSVHSLQDFTEISNFDVIRALAKWEKTDKYAGIAFGRIYGLNDEELARINPEYEDVKNWDEEKIVTKMNEFNHALTAEAHVHEFLIEGNFTVYLIDDSEKLRFAMKKLSESEKIAFGVEANYDGIQHLLRRTFNWMPDYLQRIQPKFHCVQRFIKLVGTSDTYKEIFEAVPNPSLKEVVAKWLEKDLSKGERQGNNWLKRPLTKEKMICAAKNARATMDLYYFIQKKLAERNLHDDMSTLIVTPKQIDRKRIKRKNGEKETMKEILENVEAKIKEMKETLYTFEKSENVIIVVDSGFLFIAPFLQQFGYKTFDQRNCENGEHFSRDEVVSTLSKFMDDRIADGTITHCYLLTDEYSNIRFKNKVQIDELKIINCGIDETESSIICAIMYDTNTIFDLTEVGKQCTKCGESAYVFDFPADIFQVIFIHYAKLKQFFHKLRCEDNSSKLLENLVHKKVVEIQGQKMVYHITDLCDVCFNL
uniref:Uncharacterized protein n=1 Tax=Panagrolaimus sp. PS1159 TaxID=55785 RepID=A0AC35FSE8_9BILA